MTMSDNEFVSTTATISEMQTPENTTAPFEPGEFRQPTTKPRKKRIRLTPKQRAAKIASGWNPPGPQPKNQILNQALEELAAVTKPSKVIPSKADELLKALVDKLVALENDAQYRSVWLHFFTHGGVFSGPKYIDELKEAVQYILSKGS